MNQVIAVLANCGQTVTNINKIWSVGSDAYCPILDFIHQTAKRSPKRSDLFKVGTHTINKHVSIISMNTSCRLYHSICSYLQRCLESLVLLALTPRDPETLNSNLITCLGTYLYRYNVHRSLGSDIISNKVHRETGVEIWLIWYIWVYTLYKDMDICIFFLSDIPRHDLIV